MTERRTPPPQSRLLQHRQFLQTLLERIARALNRQASGVQVSYRLRCVAGRFRSCLDVQVLLGLYLRKVIVPLPVPPTGFCLSSHSPETTRPPCSWGKRIRRCAHGRFVPSVVSLLDPATASSGTPLRVGCPISVCRSASWLEFFDNLLDALTRETHNAPNLRHAQALFVEF